MIDQQYIVQLKNQYKLYLKNVVAGQPFLPIVLRGGKNRPNTTAELHELVRLFQANEKTAFRKGWHVEWEEWTSKKFGRQQWPRAIQVTTEDDYLALIDKEKEVPRFKLLLEQICSWQPRLQTWLIQRPTIILEHESAWPSIRSVIDYLLGADVSKFYLRSIPVPVHTKFIQQYRKLIYSILHHLNNDRFPFPDADLEEALHLIRKPFLFPARWLDQKMATTYTAGMDVFAVPAAYFKRQSWHIKRVIIVENETNLFLLPEVPATLAICSYGKALHLLTEIDFLREAEMYYWGDMDEQGFCMLNDMRKYYEHVASLFMNCDVLTFHKAELALRSDKYKGLPLSRLTSQEKAAYEMLLQHNQWLEQEKLSQAYLQTELHHRFSI